MVTLATEAIDVIEFQFKEHVRLKSFEASTFPEACNLVAVASRFGLIFLAGKASELQVIQVKDIENLSREVTEFKRRIIPLPSQTLHISVNCDSTKLAVVIKKDNLPHVMFYDVLSFLKQNIQILNHVRLAQSPDSKIIQIDWNPALPDVFTAVKDDGSLLLYEFKGAPIELPPGANATCFCWSPKGKQLSVGSRDGKITQYKIDLKAVKVTEAPPGFSSIISLCWVSSFQFFGIYQAGDEASLICVDAPKTGATTYTNYDDVCYSNGSARPKQFYLIHQLNWNILFVASSNSMEVAILGMDANSRWTQWNLNDNSRAALPLGAKHEDTLPIGCTLNVGTTHYKIGEETKQGPTLLVLSDHGTLVMFNVINARPGAIDICTPLENIPDRSGEVQFLLKTVTNPPNVQQFEAHPTIAAQPIQKPVASLPQTSQLPKIPGLTINPVPIAPQAPVSTSGQIQSQTSGFGLFGSPGTFNKPASSPFNPPQPAQTQFSSAFGQKASFTPPATATVSAISPAFGQKASFTPPSTAAVSAIPQVSTNVQQKPISLINPVTPTSTKPSMTVPPSTVESPSLKQQLSERTPEKPCQTQPATKPSDKLPVTDETEAMIANLVREECQTLESELHDLIERGNATVASINIGSEAEMADMAKKELELEDFYCAIKDNINTHDSEVYTLKQALLQTWACYEEAKTRFASSKDPVTKVLLQSMPLDPATQHQLDEINRMMYYIESQLVQANRFLDEQWDTFQDYMMKVHKLKLPAMESMYQSMVKHSKTIQKQKYLLKHIANRIKNTNRVKDNTLLNVTMNNLDGVSMGLENLEEELTKLQIQQGAVPQTYTRLLERQAKLSGNKIKKLQSALTNRETSRVSVSKPQLNNSTMQLTTLLAAPLSPIEKKTLGGNKFDQFVYSTPKPKNLAELKMQKVPVQTFTPTTQGFNSGSGLFSSVATKTTSASNVSAGIFGKPSTTYGTTFATGVVVSVPGPGSTSTASSGAGFFASSTAGSMFASVKTSSAAFSSALSATATGIKTTSSGAFGSTGGGLPFGSSSQGSTFAGSDKNDVKVTKPALLATPTTPPVSAPATSIFGGAVTGFLSGLKISSEPSIFATSGTKTTSFPSFGTPVTLVSAQVSTPDFSSSSSSSSTVKAAGGGIFSAFAASAATTENSVSSTPSLFGTPSISIATTSSLSTGSIFGGSVSNLPDSGDIFEKPGSVVPPTTSIFGGVSPAATTAAISLGISSSSGIFGGASNASGTASKSIFGFSSTPATADTTTTPVVTTAASSTTTKSLFGVVATVPTTSEAVTPPLSIAPPAYSSSGSLFGGVTSATPTFTAPTTTVASSIPAATTTYSLFGIPATAAAIPSTTAATPGVSSTTSIFGEVPTAIAPASTTTATTVANPPSIFESGTSLSTTKPSTAPAFGASAFGTPSTAATITPSSIFGATSAFGTATSSTPSSIGSPFGSQAPATPVVASSAPAFGAAVSAAPAFGTAVSSTPAFAAAASTTPAFGTASAATPAFGSTPTTVSAFGAPVAQTATTTAPPAFGTGSVFGGAPAFGSPNIFGGSPATTTSATPSVFGSASTTSPFGASPFAAAATATTTSTPFGGTSSSGFSSSGNLFAKPAAKFGSIFGGTPATATTTASTGAFGSGTSVFGSPASSTTQSPFGSSAFGSASNSPFAATAANASQATSPGTTGNIFGGFGAPPAQQSPFASPQSNTTNSAFGGFGNLSVGASSFGQAASPASPASNPFGAKTEQKSTFGSTTTNLFATPASTTSGSIFGAAPTSPSIFGGGSSGFGGNSSFGQPSTFGNTSFGAPSSPAGGAFSAGGNQSVQQTGFGSASFQKPAFGSTPVFGQQPAFGGGASFGAAPTFGGGATFGSPGKVFGTGATGQEAGGGTFGAAAQSSTFGSIAQQNTVGFGNLAQQAAAPTSTLPFSGGSSFTNWRN